jgi:hypothetical protein
LYSYDTTTDTWSTAASSGAIPSARAQHCAAVYGSNMYVFGGTSASLTLGDMNAYNIQTGAWSLVSYTGPAPSARSSAGMVVDNEGRLIIFGGYTANGYVNDLHICDTVNQLWISPYISGTPPSAREGMSMTYISNQNAVYLFGGAGQSGALNDLWILDLTTLSWTNQPTYGTNIPPAREGHIAIQDNTSIIIAMGCDFGSSTCYSDTYYLSISTSMWSTMAATATASLEPVYQSAYAVLGQYVYSFGGCYLYTDCYNTMQVFDDGDPCPGDCNGQGTCRNNVCMCSTGFFANDCSQTLSCPSDCSSNGACQATGTCQCYPGWTGTICTTNVNCPNNCTSATNGACQVSATCTCNPGFTGADCSQSAAIMTCPNACSGNGVCNTQTGVCACAPYASGVDCSVTSVSPSPPPPTTTPPTPAVVPPPSSGTTTPPPAPVARTNIAYQSLNNLTTNISNNLQPPTTSTSVPEGQLTSVMFGGILPSEQAYQLQMQIPSMTEPLSSCPGSCTNNGICVNQTCYCDKGYVGKSCDQFKGSQIQTGESYTKLYEYAGACLGVGFILGSILIVILVKKSSQLEFMNIKDKPKNDIED